MSRWIFLLFNFMKNNVFYFFVFLSLRCLSGKVGMDKKEIKICSEP